MSEEENFVCELCQRRYLGEKGFLKHLDSHTFEEVKALKKLTELSLRDEGKYKDLCWELIRMEYFLRLDKMDKEEGASRK